jgi:hypothetical protein
MQNAQARFFEFFSVWAFSPETPESGLRLPLVMYLSLWELGKTSWLASSDFVPTRESRARDGQTPGRGVRSRDRAPDGRCAMAASDGPGPETWEYDVLAVAETGGVSLRHIAFDIFAREGLVEHFGIPEERFKALLERLELLYSVENPYHCALHAAVRVRRAARLKAALRVPALPALACRKTTAPLRERSRRAPLSTDSPRFPHLT